MELDDPRASKLERMEETIADLTKTVVNLQQNGNQTMGGRRHCLHYGNKQRSLQARTRGPGAQKTQFAREKGLVEAEKDILARERGLIEALE